VLDRRRLAATGDMATTDDDGYLYLVDRSKDLIIVSGFNVYPAEVEEMLSMHPAVVEAAVVGVPIRTPVRPSRPTWSPVREPTSTRRH
jgi:acyl-CoA synthetase (AMP-forming)/AMP-acid ligase II